ncbi:hypothetical protein XENTR_v10005067 [Xenopus tropicalis]|nr:hypothetical protein XENTR_v10005067 [Xenopus tropicalis]
MILSSYHVHSLNINNSAHRHLYLYMLLCIAPNVFCACFHKYIPMQCLVCSQFCFVFPLSSKHKLNFVSSLLSVLLSSAQTDQCTNM